MNKQLLLVLVGVVTVALATSAHAIPRLQAYISQGYYEHQYGGWDATWMASERNFEMSIVGGWKGARGGQPPTAANMETYLVVGVLKGESGSVTINGVELTEAHGVKPRGMTGSPRQFLASPQGPLEVRYYSLGGVSNGGRGARNYRPSGWTTSGHWGDEFTLSINVDGFSLARFNALGIDDQGLNYYNPISRDATFAGGTTADTHTTPEPGTLALLGASLTGVIPFLRRRKKAA